MILLRKSNLIVAGLMVSTLFGCGETRKDLATVTGTITVDGAPLPDAQVVFAPTTSTGTTSYGKTDSDGNYTMMATRSAEGASLGQNTVRITTADVIDQDGKEVVVKEKLPRNYNKQSELTADVQPGANTFDFALESGDKKIKQPKLTDE